MEKPTMMLYINEEKEVLTSIIDHYTQTIPVLPVSKHWLVLATGSSFNAALSAKYYVEKLAGLRLSLAEPFAYSHYERFDETIEVVLGLSQSGESTSTIGAIEKIKQNYPVLTYGLSAKMDSELIKLTDHAIDIGCGVERVGYVTKGYVATIFTLMLTGLRYAAAHQLITAEQEQKELDDFRRAIQAIPSIISKSEAFFDRWQHEWVASPRFSAIGYGANFGACKEMETKFAETVRMPSQGYEMEAFMHGPYLEVNKEHRIFFLEMQSTVQHRLNLLKAYEQKCTPYVYSIALATGDNNERTLSLNLDIDEFKAPLFTIIPFQVWAHHIAEARGNRLTERIYTDFGVSVQSKTKPGDYA